MKLLYFLTYYVGLLLLVRIKAFPSKEDLACQGHEVTLLCPGEEVVEVQNVMYGRQNSDRCVTSDDQMFDTGCVLSSAFETVSDLCNNKSICSIEVSSKIFTDPCPGTHKYLTVQYTCLKFMFSCFGPFNGFHNIRSLTTDLLPQSGILVKDPLSNLDRVYFATWSQNQDQIKEYANLDEFSMGNSQDVYVLRSRLGVPNFVVFDSNIYYVKEGSCNIVKYGMMLRRRSHEISIGASHSGYGCSVSLMTDEFGLWAVYKNSNNNLVMLHLDPQNLHTLAEFVVDYQFIPYLHKTFMMCGVLYVVGTQTNTIEYQFDTLIGDEKTKYLPSNGNSKNSFFKLVNVSSLSYNPRSKEFYAWNSYTSRALIYTLEYITPDEDEELMSDFESVTMETSPSVSPVISNEDGVLPPVIVPNYPLPDSQNYCPSVRRHGILWPTTKVGLKTVLPCPLDIGENATWECVRDSSLPEASWHIAGPNLLKCATWVTDIENNFNQERISSLEAVEDLKVSLNNQLLDVTYMPLPDATACIRLAHKLLQYLDYEDYQDNLAQLKTTSQILDIVLDTLEEGWDEHHPHKRMKTVHLLLETITNVMKMNDELQLENALISTAAPSFKYHNFVGTTSCPSEETQVLVLTHNVTKKHTGNKIHFIPTSENSQSLNCSRKVQFLLVDKIAELLSFSAESLRDEDELSWMAASYVAYVKSSVSSFSHKAVLSLYNKENLHGETKCAMWKFLQHNNKGFWDEDVCEVVKRNSTHVDCSCSETSGLFALLVRASLASEGDLIMATNVVMIGLAFCTLCLCICLVSMICTRGYYYKQMSQKHLLICLLLTEVSFIVGSYQTNDEVICKVMSGCLQFFMLASFLWVMLDAVQLYVTYVRGANDNKLLWILYCALGYGIPAAVVATSAAVDIDSFSSHNSCWIRTESSIIWSFVVPLCLVVCVNMIVLSVTLYRMCKHRLAFAESSRPQTVKMAVRGTSLLLSLLAFNWSFGIMWLSERMAILGYLFAIFNIFQGLFMLLFRCIIPMQTKQSYRKSLFGFLSGGITKTSFNGKDFPNRFRSKDDKSSDMTSFNTLNHVSRNNSMNIDYKW